MGGEIAVFDIRIDGGPARGRYAALRELSDPANTNAKRAAERAAREGYGKLVAILTMHSRDIAAAEDALSEALLSALATWPDRGIPDNPEAWLVTAARNRLRNEDRARLVRVAAEPDLMIRADGGREEEPGSEIVDDRLRLMLVCAHPAIDPAARAPLILQTVLGLTAGQIARAFMVDPAAMSQRLVRAKTRIRDIGLRFTLPERAEMEARQGAILDAIYAAFGQGWDGWEHPDTPEALSGEAIWLARLVVRLLPNEPEPKGLLALMLYCAARADARLDDAGRFVPLDRQDTTRWDKTRIIEAENLLIAASSARQFGRYQCEAAIQSVHCQRPVTGHTNVEALRVLYDLLVTKTGSIGAHIARAVVLAESGNPQAGLAALGALDERRVRDHQPYWVARSMILRSMGRKTLCLKAIRKAVDLTRDAALLAHLEVQRQEIIARI